MTTQLTLMSHGKVLGYTGAAFPPDELPAGASVWHLVPTTAFDFVEPIIAELTAPPAFSLVEEVIPTPDAYLHPARHEHEAQMERLVHEAARIHHFRLVLERYEELDLELRDASGRRVPTTTLLVSKQVVSADALQAYVETIDPCEAHQVNTAEPCYLLMARLASASSESVESVASAA
ncbi:MAG: hypothetical protein ACJ79A_19750 [Gemmatimonadaceae bacterium]